MTNTLDEGQTNKRMASRERKKAKKEAKAKEKRAREGKVSSIKDKAELRQEVHTVVVVEMCRAFSGCLMRSS